MKSFKEFLLQESKIFNNWVMPDKEAIKLEYKLEYEMKGLKGLTNDAWPSFQDFEKSVKEAKVVKFDASKDRTVQYRSGTRNQKELLSLIKSYRSYPEFRNEKTLQAIYDGFKNGSPMKMPIVLEFPNGNLRIMGGNTRADVAMRVLGHYKALLVKIPAK